MIKKTLLTLISTLILVSTAHSFETTATHAILIDATSNEIIFEKNADIAMHPSSMSKIMTSYIVSDYLKKGKISLQDTFITSENAWRKGGSRMFIPLKKAVTVEDLLRGLIIQSGNDAAIALAEGIMGSEQNFAIEMNNYAKMLGMQKSNFKNATGWPDDEHYSTCKDLALLAKRTIEDFPEYYSYYAEKDFTYNNIKQPNRNRLLWRDIGCDGLKTGHTDVGGYGLVFSAIKNGRRLIAVVNGLRSESERAEEAERLLNYGFFSFTNMVIARKGQVLDEARVYGGVDSYISLVAKEDIVLTVPNHLTDKTSLKLEYKSPLIAPLKRDESIAKLIVNTGEKIKQYDIFPSDDIKKSFFLKRIFLNAGYFLFN